MKFYITSVDPLSGQVHELHVLTHMAKGTNDSYAHILGSRHVLK